jgi:RNA polymerase sigma-70 factor (ECF subfamily)
MEQSDPGQFSDSGLLERCREGDDQAFRLLVERFQPKLMATAAGMVGPGHDAEEVVQEAFVRFYRALHRFEGRSSLGTYLTRITMNEALKVIRKQKPWRFRLLSRDDPDSLLAEPIEFPSEPAMDKTARADRIRQAVQSLNPEFRNVVVLRFLNEYSTAECAQILEIPQGTVMSRLSRALEKLSPILQSVYENE